MIVILWTFAVARVRF